MRGCYLQGGNLVVGDLEFKIASEGPAARTALPKGTTRK